MKKNLILLVALLLCRHFLSAQNLSGYVTGPIGHTTFSWPCTGPFQGSCPDKEKKMKTEYPPYIISGIPASDWRTYFLTDGDNSSVASHPGNMVTSSELNFKTNGNEPVYITQPSTANTWRNDYYSVYSAQYINHPAAGTVSIGFAEGENHHQPSTGQPTSPCDWMEGNASTTYLCLTWTPNTPATNWGHQYFTDEGPIIWPAAGYRLPNGQKSSLGCANNTSIQGDDGYLYIFYKDQSCYELSVQMGPGRLPGIKVARAPISDALNPHAYQTYYQDASGVVQWNQSLPAGFNKDNIGSYLNTPGPQGTPILETDRDYTRFAVARVVGGATNYYMGLGNYPDPDDSKMWWDPAKQIWQRPQVTCLKFSTDLIHWVGDREIYRETYYGTSKFNYPIFLNADGWSNTTIDENNFYIIGTQSDGANGLTNITYKMRVYIPPPPPQPQPGGPIACEYYMYIGADPSTFHHASGARLADIDITGDKLTVEAVFKRTEDFSHDMDGGTLVSKHSNSTDANYFLRPESGGITTTDGYFQIDLPCDLEMETTYHIAMVYDGAQLSIYRNGSLEASVPATGNLVTNDWQTTIGTEAAYSNWELPVHFRGYITEVRIWKKARTTAEIQQYKNQTITYAYNDPNLLAYFSAGNQGVFPNGIFELFGNASYYQTNPYCAPDTYGCYGPARKGNGTTKEAVKGDAQELDNSKGRAPFVYPNPGPGTYRLNYTLKGNAKTQLNVLDLMGRQIRAGAAVNRPAGTYTEAVNISGLAKGVYMLELLVNGKKQVFKVIYQ
jgi:hypothetical protein